MQLQLYGKKIWVYHKPIDFRRSIDGLSSFINTDMQHNPQLGIFLFYNKGKDKIKCLSWHKNGWAPQRSYIGDGRRPSVIGLQEQATNHCKQS